MSTYRGRFAPSPTGPLHFGSLISACASYAQARAHGGQWLVRIENLDPPREVEGSAATILAQLESFGMVSDEPVLYQDERIAAYREATEKLLADGLAFGCACSRKDLPDSGIYPGTCEAGLPDGTHPRSIRLRVPHEVLGFHDRVQGRFEQHLARDVGAFVIRRADGFHAYQLAVVVDDASQGITEVVRGCDLLDSTPRQIYLQHCLGLPTPEYLHHPVAIGPDRQKLSKRVASDPVDAAYPMPAMLEAWRFLGQPRPPPRPRHSPTAFWDWAVHEWQSERIPARIEIEVAD